MRREQTGQTGVSFKMRHKISGKMEGSAESKGMTEDMKGIRRRRGEIREITERQESSKMRVERVEGVPETAEERGREWETRQKKDGK